MKWYVARSLMCVPAKIFGRLSHLYTRKILGEEQASFREIYSCMHHCLVLYYLASKYMKCTQSCIFSLHRSQESFCLHRPGVGKLWPVGQSQLIVSGVWLPCGILHDAALPPTDGTTLAPAPASMINFLAGLLWLLLQLPRYSSSPPTSSCFSSSCQCCTTPSSR